MKHRFGLWFLSILLISDLCAQTITPGANRMEKYLPLLHGKTIAVVANHTSVVNKKNIVDSLLLLGIKIKVIFSPEHGFRGVADAGEVVNNSIDSVSKLPVISLFGNYNKPKKEDLTGIDVIVFDIQDVGVRFYTYISTMHYVMEACAEQNIPFIVLDRPNPNGYYIDGPVLKPLYKSFVGMDQVPIVYGMTIGEYARMVNGEGWLAAGKRCGLTVIECLGYTHASRVDIPIKPSPNLPNALSIQLYPTLCLFEGTVVSVGRGTDYPFQVIGHPGMIAKGFTFKPRSIPGICKTPMFQDQICNGIDFRSKRATPAFEDGKINLAIISYAYKNTILKEKQQFFNSFFTRLSGTDELKQQLIDNMPETQIRASWQKDLDNFKTIRSKYLLYKDF
jgi:uncharacterized protein YbbC (DUF1343 family)